MLPTDDATEVFKSLFTEIAIVEHLVRTRAENLAAHEISVAEFGVLNYFERQGLSIDQEATLAWCFQDDADHMARKIDLLVQHGFVFAEGPRLSRKVAITDSGREARARALAAMQRELGPLVAGFDLEEAKTALKLLRELRRTLDNLPDR